MQGSADKFVRDVRVVVQDAEELIRATAGDIEEKTREARAKLAGALVVAKESLHRADTTAAVSVRAADGLIRDYRYQTIGTAFLVGLLFGVLVTRR